MSVELTSAAAGADSRDGAYPSLAPPIPPRLPAVDKGGPPYGSTATGSSSAVPPSSSASSASEDPYEAARRSTPCRYFCYRYITPWCRMLLIVITLYLYAMSSGVLTYRNNDFQDQMQRLVNTQPNPNDPTATIPGDPPSTHPEREDDVTNYPYLDGRVYVPFILRDLFFDFIPALQGNTRSPWKSFVDATPIIWNVIMLLMLLIRMDIIRWSEYIAIQWVLFSVNALVHVSTTYPDATGYQDSCLDPAKHVAGGWMWHYITTAYCGDMMWSGHTQETLIPLIMIRRLMWDFLGWNLTWAASEDVLRHDTLDKHPQVASGAHSDHQFYMHMVQRHQQQAASHEAVEGKEPPRPAAPPDTYAPQYLAAQGAGGPQSASAVEDARALQAHEKYDVHLNVAQATALQPNQQPNVSHDIFFRNFKSPYQTPDIVERHRVLAFTFATFIRVVMLIWFPFLLVGLLLCRYHYSADLLVAIFVTSLVCTNTHLLQWWVRTLCYRPFYLNYMYGWYEPVYLRWPLNAEQVNFEERVRRVGIGGLL